MNIHKENELKNVKDSHLLRRLLFYAKPYWKTIVLSFFMAAFIVMATLAQPLIIKIAIDDRINGIYKPMVSVDQAEEAQYKVALKQAGWKIQSTVHWQGKAFMRMKALNEDKMSSVLPSGGAKQQIYTVEDQHYFVSDWLSDPDESLVQTGVPLSENDFQVFRQQDYNGFISLGIAFLLLIVAAAVTNYYQMKMLEGTGQSIIYDIRQKMFKHLTQLQTAYFDKNPVGRLVTRISHDVEALNQLYSQVLVNLVKELCMLVGIIIIMFSMSVELALIAFTVIPVLAVISFYYRRMFRNVQRYTRVLLSKLNSFIAENLSGIRVIQIFAREEKQLEQFNQINDEHYRAGMKGTIINSIFNPTIQFIGMIALALIIWYGGGAVLNGTVLLGVVIAFTLYVQQFFKPLIGLADRYNQIQTALASAERIFDMLDERPTVTNLINPQKISGKMKGVIEFDRVWFSYNENEWVLKDLSFRIEAGETVAFVGATGAGKSSIINLINRFYDIQQGSLRIDGIDVKEMNIHELRKHVGIIQQDAFIFSGDVKFNIRLNTDMTDAEVVDAAKSLQMDEFIMKLPDQYETQIGEQGVTLSSGQQQLLSFLRASVFNPDILILDEATANIDTETEQVVQDALKRISVGRTTLIVAHRLSTIRDADKIIVLHKGQIQEVGNHNQLLQKKGYYYRLYKTQNNDKGMQKSHSV